MKKWLPSKIFVFLVCSFLLVVIAFWMGGRLAEVRSITQHMRSWSRFGTLEAALLRYYDRHGSFPPLTYQASADGPRHSWRVLLWPYTDGEPEQFSKYDFSQEWNSPANMAALGNSPAGYYYQDRGPFADYLAIGDDDKWPSKEPLRARVISKGKDRFLIVEYPDSTIHWMEPRY